MGDVSLRGTLPPRQLVDDLFQKHGDDRKAILAVLANMKVLVEDPIYGWIGVRVGNITHYDPRL
jgi:hypothetical protein